MKVLNLEAALLNECTSRSILNICKGKPLPERLRPQAWAACLGTKEAPDQLVNFKVIFDLPEQELLRQHCQEVVDRLGNDDGDKVCVVSGIESILTHYCKSNHMSYTKVNGWIELLLPILALKRPISETYNMFESIIRQYIPKTSTNDIYHLLRLLVLYHDPNLCSFLDTKKVTPDLYAGPWFRCLFAGTCDLKVIQIMWDLYFQQNDPFFIFFLALVIVLNGKEHILKMETDSKTDIVTVISAMPASLEYNDVADFCSLAQYYALRTPVSFKKELFAMLFECEEGSSALLSQSLCLPISANELVENAAESEFLDTIEDGMERVRFFLVDCRPADQYNAGHLPTAFHLDCNLMLQEPAAFGVAVQGLLSAQRQSLAVNSSAAGEHLCFLGSGRDEEDQYTHMVIASFLQKHVHFVSMLAGGYQAIHDYFGSELSDCLEEHDTSSCLVCSSHQLSDDVAGRQKTQGEEYDLFGKISAVVKEKSADLKGKLIEYMINPSGSEVERHVSSKDKVGKPYRNIPSVFSIDGDEHLSGTTYQEADEEEEQTQLVPLSKYLKSDETVAYYECAELKENGIVYESYLVVTRTHLLVLRKVVKNGKTSKGEGVVVIKRLLSTIVKITSKKKHPAIITFSYGTSHGDTVMVSDMDRFNIPQAKEAIKVISSHIYIDKRQR